MLGVSSPFKLREQVNWNLNVIWNFKNNANKTKKFIVKSCHSKKKTVRFTIKYYICALKYECLLVKKNITPIKIKSYCKNVDFEWRYIRTHTTEKPSNISNITTAILPFLSEKYSNKIDILNSLEFTSNHQMNFKMVNLNIKFGVV